MTANTLAVRGRYISPAFWTSDDVCELPSDSHRVMFVGLWAAADREGRLADEPGRIGRRVRPWDPKGAAALITDLVSVGMVRRYTAEGHRCLSIPAFKKWQRVHPHEARSALPAPPDRGDQPTVLDVGLKCDDSETIDEESQESLGDQPHVFECPPEPSEPSEPSGKSLCEVQKAELHPAPLELELSEPDEPPVSLSTVFGHWKRVMKSSRSKLDSKRRKLIAARLAEGYSVEDLKRAIDGCALDSFSMGQNNRNRAYNGIGVIFRDAEHVEKFMGYADKPPPRERSGPDPNTGIIVRTDNLCAVCGEGAEAQVGGQWLCYGQHLAAAEAWAQQQKPDAPWEADVSSWVASQRSQGAAA